MPEIITLVFEKKRPFFCKGVVTEENKPFEGKQNNFVGYLYLFIPQLDSTYSSIPFTGILTCNHLRTHGFCGKTGNQAQCNRASDIEKSMKLSLRSIAVVSPSE